MGYAQAAGLPADHRACTPRSSRSCSTRCSVRVRSWSSVRTRRSPRSSPRPSPRSRSGDPTRATDLAAGLALISGAFCVAFGVLRLGLLTDLLSKPIRIGYLNGIALTVFIGQLPKLFGFSVDADGVVAIVPRVRRWASPMARPVPAALAIGLASIAVIVVVPTFAAGRSPASSIAAVGGDRRSSGCPGAGGLGRRPGRRAAATGPARRSAIPARIARRPGWRWSPAGWRSPSCRWPTRACCRAASPARSGCRVDQNQELLALGVANAGRGPVLRGSRSARARRGPRSPRRRARRPSSPGSSGRSTIAALLRVRPGPHHEPAAGRPRRDRHDGVPVPRRRRTGWSGCGGSGLRVRAVDRVLRRRRRSSASCPGIFFAVALALAAFIWRAWRPYSAVLGRVDGLKGYHDVTRYPDARQIDGLVLFRWDAPLFFANAELFREQVEAAITVAPTPTRWVVVAAEPSPRST